MFVCAYRANSRKRLARRGRADAVSLDRARKKAMTYLAMAANQEDPQSNLDARREMKTIDELVESVHGGSCEEEKEDLEGGPGAPRADRIG